MSSEGCRAGYRPLSLPQRRTIPKHSQVLNALRSLARFLVLAAAPTSLRADLLVDPVQIDFGNLKQQTIATTEVRLLNTGDEPVALMSTHADCGCTVANLKTHLLEPGTSTLLAISIETRDYSGALNRRVHVETSAGEVVVPIKMNVVPYEQWILTPSALVMPASPVGEEAKMRATLTFSGAAGVNLHRIESAQDWLQVLVGSADQRHFNLELTKVKGAPSGRHSVKVTIETDDPKEPLVTFNVAVPVLQTSPGGAAISERGEVQQTTLRAIPSTITMPPVGPGETSKREFVLQGWESDKLPEFALRNGVVREIRRQGGELVLELAVTPARTGRSSHKLRVFDRDRLVLEVPVIVRVEPPAHSAGATLAP